MQMISTPWIQVQESFMGKALQEPPVALSPPLRRGPGQGYRWSPPPSEEGPGTRLELPGAKCCCYGMLRRLPGATMSGSLVSHLLKKVAIQQLHVATCRF